MAYFNIGFELPPTLLQKYRAVWKLLVVLLSIVIWWRHDAQWVLGFVILLCFGCGYVCCNVCIFVKLHVLFCKIFTFAAGRYLHQSKCSPCRKEDEGMPFHPTLTCEVAEMRHLRCRKYSPQARIRDAPYA